MYRHSSSWGRRVPGRKGTVPIVSDRRLPAAAPVLHQVNCSASSHFGYLAGRIPEGRSPVVAGSGAHPPPRLRCQIQDADADGGVDATECECHRGGWRPPTVNKICRRRCRKCGGNGTNKFFKTYLTFINIWWRFREPIVFDGSPFYLCKLASSISIKNNNASSFSQCIYNNEPHTFSNV